MFEEFDAQIVPEETEMLRDEAVSEISIHYKYLQIKYQVLQHLFQQHHYL